MLGQESGSLVTKDRENTCSVFRLFFIWFTWWYFFLGDGHKECKIVFVKFWQCYW